MQKEILIINGPNLNLLGVREPEVYGSQSFDAFFSTLQKRFPEISLTYFQSNCEGSLVSKIQEKGFEVDGIILNAAAYTHTSVALRDAISLIKAPVVEVHISNVYSRESFRHESKIAAVCRGVIAGFGLNSYVLALQALLTR